MNVKPNRLLILLGYIAAMVGVIMLMSPDEIKLSEDVSIKIFSLDDMLPKAKADPKVDLSAIKELEANIESLEENDGDTTETIDTTDDKEELIELVPEKLNKEIQFPEDNPNVLDNFFNALKSLDTKPELIRIVHYGDSQIEGDRISEYLRNRFQTKFGGCGVGMVPVTEIKNIRSTMQHENSENVVRYEVFGVYKKPSLHNHYGYLGSYHKFAYQLPDSLGEVEPKWVNGKLTYKKTYLKTYKKVNQVEQISIAYRNRFSPLVIDGTFNESLDVYDSLGLHQSFAVWKKNFSGSFKQVNLNLRSKGDPEVFGVSFDCKHGVALDNAPFRGSSGTEFTQINKQVFAQQVKRLNIKFMIVQFGVNVIPYVRTEYGYYKKRLKKQLQFLKSLSPELDVIVIGPSDMARKKDEDFASYPNVPVLRDAMREAAFESGCAFWDLYGAMGGRGSISAWVDSKPALANPDYTHFTRTGAKLVGEMFFNALMKTYQQRLTKLPLNENN